jgi:nucleoside-diphosphate-sugar epimerase
VRRYIYASSCSVYGYTENELFDEDRPVASQYTYGISKLQGEQAVMQLIDTDFSVIALRKRTVSGYSSILGFHWHHSVKTIVRNLVENMPKCNAWDNPNYHNIQVFKGLDEGEGAKLMTSPTGARR